MRRIPLRLRVTLASAVSTAIILAALSLFVYARMQAELVRALDLGLQARAEAIASGLGQRSVSVADAPDTGPGSLAHDSAQILTPAGQVTTWGGWATPRLSAAALRAISGPTFVQLPAAQGWPSVPGFVLPTDEGQRLFVVVGSSLAGVHQTLAGLRLLLLVADPAALALACLAAWFLTGLALRPVESMRQEAAAISVSEPGRRLPVWRANDEVARLGHTLNSLLDRLQGALSREQRLLSDASHELRTPLAIMKAELDLSLSRARTPEELEAALRSASEETDRLARLAEDLLVLSRTHGGELPIHRVSTSLDELLGRACGGHQARAGARGAHIRCQAPPARIMIDPMRVRQAVDNLLDNAIRHSRPGTPISVDAAMSGDVASITVENSGAGFADDILPRAFEPFVRGRPRPEDPEAFGPDTAQGAGLGLTIVRAVAQAHGGTAIAQNVPGGARLTMTLALGAEAAEAADAESTPG
jgi:two-component system, OmpR family, sensor kinase